LLVVTHKDIIMASKLLGLVVCILLAASAALADGPKKVLLLAGKPSHSRGAHEHIAGLKLLQECLQDVAGLETSFHLADGKWPEGPGLIRKADGIALYLDTGSHWEQATAERKAALDDLMARGGGVVALHWAIGGQEAKFIPFHLKLVGGCHGGPDRKYTFGEADLKLVAPDHSIARATQGLHLKDEFYYQLKWAKEGKITPILSATIEDVPNQTIVWAFERPDGGRSAGFACLHELKTFGVTSLRRMVAQSVLWSVKLPVPEGGLPVKIAEEDLAAPPRE
jgi:hypothetical protein